MFLGEYSHNIDKKGRLIIPARFRDELGSSFILTCGFEKCLTVYPVVEWEEYAEKISRLPVTDRDARAFARLVYSKAQEVSLDRLGRIVIPANLRQYADLDKEAVLNGNFATIEIWQKANWEKYSEHASENFEKQAQRLSDYFT